VSQEEGRGREGERQVRAGSERRGVPVREVAGVGRCTIEMFVRGCACGSLRKCERVCVWVLEEV
jgi:hypothetical protein